MAPRKASTSSPGSAAQAPAITFANTSMLPVQYAARSLSALRLRAHAAVQPGRGCSDPSRAAAALALVRTLMNLAALLRLLACPSSLLGWRGRRLPALPRLAWRRVERCLPGLLGRGAWCRVAVALGGQRKRVCPGWAPSLLLRCRTLRGLLI